MDILLLEELVADARQWLEARHHVDYRPELLEDEALLRGRLYKVDALVVPPRLKINAQLLDYAPRLAAVGRIHDGTENLDFEACQKRHVRVIQASSATVRASAEHQLCTLMQLFRSGGQVGPSLSLRRGAPGREINDSVIGLFGLAPPAHVLATMLVPLGVRVVGYDPAVHRNAELWRRLGVQPMALTDMLEVVRTQLRQGDPVHEIIVVAFDSGARVGTDPMPFIFAISRRVLRRLAEHGSTYIEIDNGTVTVTATGPAPTGATSEATIKGRVLRFLLDEAGAFLNAEVRPGRFMYVVKVGDDLSVGTLGPKPN